MKVQFFKIIPVYLPALLVILGLCFLAAESASSDSSQRDQKIEEAEDCDSWIHIRNVSIYDDTTNELQRDMFVLVTGTHIHKIGKTPLFIMDKDVTYTINGEGRIMLPIHTEKQQSENSEKSGSFEEEAPANLLIVDAESMVDLNKLTDNPAFQKNQNLTEIEEIRLLMENGEIIKNTLPRSRVARIGLRKFKER